MRAQQAEGWTRRRFLGGLTLAGTAGLLGLRSMPVAAEPPPVLSGEVDIVLNFVGPLLVRLDAGDPLVILAGGHVGCFELFGSERVRAIRDLNGKTVAVPHLGSPQHVFLASMAAYVGLAPQKDITWVTHAQDEAMQLFAEEKIDAFLGSPPHKYGV